MYIEEIGVDVYEGSFGCRCRARAQMDGALLWMYTALLRMNRAFVCRYTALWQIYGALLWMYLALLRMNRAFVRICMSVVVPRGNEEMPLLKAERYRTGADIGLVCPKMYAPCASNRFELSNYLTIYIVS